MLDNLLKYWHSLEFFQPSWPIDEKKDINLHKKDLPWLCEENHPDKQVSYNVYLGCGIAYDLIVWLLDSLKLNNEDSPVERDQSKCCVCALKVDESGIYIADSFAISSFIWALSTMIKANDFGAKLTIGDLEKFQNDINIALCEDNNAFSIDVLEALLLKIYKETGLESKHFKSTIWACMKVDKRKKDGTFPALIASTELISSFYLYDINRVMKNPGNQVKRYAQSLFKNINPRFMIDTDIDIMEQWLKANCFPRGTWPSKYSPSLMQQLAINLSISGQDIFSVNGPPGTGKTTLLKEIVASNIVERAKLMSKYMKPDDAFSSEAFTSPPDNFSKKYYCPHHELTAYGMLVASNNNAAVENISIELPKLIAEDRTNQFTDFENPEETYFSDIASALLKEPAWGLISARLGKSSNLKEFKQALWWDKSVNLLQYYKLQPPDWDTAKQNFITAWDNVENERLLISKAQKQVKEYTKIIEEENVTHNELKKLEIQVDEQKNLYDDLEKSLNEIEKLNLLHRKNIDILKSNLSWLKRLLPGISKKDAMLKELDNLKELFDETLITMTRKRTELHMRADELRKSEERLKQQKKLCEALQIKKSQLHLALESERNKFGANFADNYFYQDISKNDKSQSACPWTYNYYNELREELFFRALMLQKAFVLNSNSVKQNLMRLFDLWDGKYTKKDRESAYGCLLNTLFFVVPVISTTFASVQSFLEGVKPGELGILVVDESGQATPQSALGALWRTQKAIVVGDPLQVEPIMNTPIELCQRFADDTKLPTNYRIPELSVQMLADAQNPYGGIRTIESQQLWLGCPLVIHRRCIEPMFSMSNQIAYSGRMFCKTVMPKPEIEFLLEDSTWFDVSGKEVGSKDHTVKEQIQLIAQLLEKAVMKFNSLPDLYIITPFTSVKRSIERKLRPLLKELLPEMDEGEIDNWLKSNCGTIHTFQGKEANEVLLVLGCDASQGMGAAGWVGQKPNIINVAVSRAKYRIGVIGSYNLWCEIRNVKEICKMLQDSIVTIKT
ncbi:MAG: AAA domain-containing protein [Lachnospiraceae bacterium]|nr:AAA domain-containing protein [Lachnospiraceae bacterium]